MNPLATRSAVVVAAVLACSNVPSGSAQVGPSGELRLQVQRNCPMSADDVVVEAGLVSTGTTLRFTTRSGDVAELRRRVQYLGDVYGTYDGTMAMDWFQVRDPGTQALNFPSLFAAMPIVSVAIVDLETGAQIFFSPTQPEDLDTVRAQTAVHRQHLAAGQCWMPKDLPLMPSAPVLSLY